VGRWKRWCGLQIGIVSATIGGKVDMSITRLIGSCDPINKRGQKVTVKDGKCIMVQLVGGGSDGVPGLDDQLRALAVHEDPLTGRRLRGCWGHRGRWLGASNLLCGTKYE